MATSTGTGEVIMTATITRADGSKEELGVISREKVDASFIKKIFNKK